MYIVNSAAYKEREAKPIITIVNSMKIFILYIIICFIMSETYASALNSHIVFFKTLEAEKIPDIAYCENIQEEVLEEENIVIQKLVKLFASETNCIISSCLQQWGKQGNHIKYSVAYQEQCGPIIAGQYQLGDNGKGSTFVCERSKNSVCCWPLGYEYQLKICSQNGIYDIFYNF